jgi:hypothetical protein
VRADRLDTLVWEALSHLLHTPSVIPQLHQAWAHARQQHLSALGAQQPQLSQRQQRLEHQSRRLVDAYQAEIINLDELRSRRQRITQALQQIEQERQQLAQTQQQTAHWQQVIENVDTFRQLLGDNLEQLSFEERHAVVQCLVSNVIVTGEHVDIYYALPFELAPQLCHHASGVPEGTPGHFYRLRLAHLNVPMLVMQLLERTLPKGRVGVSLRQETHGMAPLVF